MKLYYGWVIVLALSVTQLVGWGALYYTFGVLLPAMQAELGWPRAVFAGGFSLALLVSGLAAIPVGRWVDQHGTRLIMTLGSGLGVLVLLGWSLVTDQLSYYLVWGLLGLASAACLYEPAFAAVATWFRVLRRRALAVLTFFGGLASLVFIPLTGWLASSYGWRAALVWLAAIMAVCTIPLHALLLRARPADMGQHPDGARPEQALVQIQQNEPSISLPEALRQPSLWLLGLAFSLTNLVVTALNVYLVSYLVETGYPAEFAAWAAGLHGLMSVSGRMAVAPLGNRWSLTGLISGLFLMQALSVVVLLLWPGQLGVLLYVALFGIGSGAATPTRAALIGERYGVASYGRINGALQTMSIWARVAAPVGGGLLATTLGYPTFLWGLVAAATLAALAVILAVRVAGN